MRKNFRYLLIIVFLILLTLIGLIVFIVAKYPDLRKDELSTLNTLRKELDYNEVVITDIKLTTFIQRISDILNAENEIRNARKYQDQKEIIIKNFDNSIKEYSAKISKYSQVDLTFLPTNLDQIDFGQKKKLDKYLLELKKKFKENIVNYNLTAEELIQLEYDPNSEVYDMTIDEKVGQMFTFAVNGTILSNNDEEFLKNQKPGGVVFLGENVSNSLKDFTQSIQRTNTKYPLFIQIDQEGGAVKRITWDTTPAPKEIAQLSKDNQCKEFQKRAELLNTLGVNWNLGIVADVTNNPNSFIYLRTYGGDFTLVGNIIENAVECSNKILTTLKHYPGHGSTLGDTHLGPLDINSSKEDWLKNELIPFKSGLNAGSDSLMIGHLRLKWLDPANPASISKDNISYIRNTLKYDGILITDDLKMLEAGGYSKEDALKLAITAGEDTLLYSYNDSTRDYLINFAKKEIKNGLITEEELNSHVKRILNAKNKIIKLGIYVPASLVY